jgi:peroxiredoxin (alkyl hydroperoxide reductase subunit C)
MEEITYGIRPGQPVPEFKMETFEPSRNDFGEMSLSEMKEAKKWTVLFFYPADFTFVCATEFAALAERQDEFKQLGAEIVTVSTDTKFTHLAWQRDEKMLEKAKYVMASDRTGKVSRMFGVYDDASGLALRGAFIINPQGVLLTGEINFFNLGRNIDELLRKVRANIYLAGNPAEVCPAHWVKAGDKTLKPSAKLVGKIYEALQ